MSTPSEFHRLQKKLDSEEGLDFRELGLYSAKLRNHYAAKCSEVQRLLAEVKQLRGDLNIARLERDAKRWSAENGS